MLLQVNDKLSFVSCSHAATGLSGEAKAAAPHLGVAARITAAARPDSPYSAVDPKRGTEAKVLHHPAAISAAASPSKYKTGAPSSAFTAAWSPKEPSMISSAADSRAGRVSGDSGLLFIAFSDVLTCKCIARLEAGIVKR